MPIKSLRAGWRRDTFQTQYPMCFHDYHEKKKFLQWIPTWNAKSRDGGGNNAYKVFTSRVEEGYIPITISYVELFMTPMKMKNNFCDGHQYEMQKSHDGGENNAYKIIVCRVEEGYITCKDNILFGGVHSYNEKEAIFWIVKKVNIMKPKSQDRRGDSVKRPKNAKTSTKRCLSTTKDQAQAY